MRKKICLRALNAAGLEQLLVLLERVLPHLRSKRSVKEKYYRDNDMYKYSSVRFYDDVGGLRVSCSYGCLVVSDKLSQISEILIEYPPSSAAKAEKLVRMLLTDKLQFVLEEPDISLRIDQLRGCLRLEDMAGYDAGSVQTALRCHLPWQLYAVSKAWGELAARPGEKPLVRQLRVKLRRLRSVAVFFRPLLTDDKNIFWQRQLRERTGELSAAREYDVTLLACAKIRANRAELELEEANALATLENLLQERRRQAEAKLAADTGLNTITGELAAMLFYLQNTPLLPKYKKYTLKEYLREHLQEWCERLLVLSERYPDLTDMEQLHQIRIKIKRFRYCLQGLPEISVPMSLLRCLKSLQDQLGLLHDNYVNDDLISGLLEQHGDSGALRCECAMFSGWERAKVEAALAAAPEQWQDFCRQLQEWRCDYL